MRSHGIKAPFTTKQGTVNPGYDYGVMTNLSDDTTFRIIANGKKSFITDRINQPLERLMDNPEQKIGIYPFNTDYRGN